MNFEEVVASLDDYVHPLVCVEPNGDETAADDGLSLLVDRVADADVVGLGEVTHGTRECNTIRHRAIRRLVTEHGFRTIAIEADVGNTRRLDRFVRDGKRTATDALAGIDRWVWNTESLVSLFEWLRSFNDGRPADDMVSVHGVEMGDPRIPARHLEAFFEDVAPDDTKATAALELLVTQVLDEYDESEQPARIDAAIDAVETLRTRLADNADAYIAESSEERLDIARNLARCVEQAYEYQRLVYEYDKLTEETLSLRERMTAENVARFVETGRGGVIHLAHDVHLKRGTVDDSDDWTDARTRGSRLADRFGDGYRTVGFGVGRGRVKAVDLTDTDRPVRNIEIGDPLDGTLTAALDAVADGPAYLDLRQVRDDATLASWFDKPQHKRFIGAVFDATADPERYYLHTDIAESWDGICFVPVSTPTTRIEA